MGKVNTIRFWLGLALAALSLIVICQHTAFCTPPEWRHPGYGPSKITLSKEPKLGEEIVLTYTITPKANIPNARIKFSCNEGVDYVRAKDNVEILNRKLARVYFTASKNKSISFTLHVKFISNTGTISATANEAGKDKEGKEQVGLWFGKAYLNCVLVDSATGRLGTTGEYYSGIMHRYNPAAGEFLKESDPGVDDINRGIVKRMKTFEPTLSDSEALALHGDMVQGIMFGIGVGKKDASKPAKEVEDIIIRYLLKEGWLVKLKDGTKDKWFQKLKKESKEKWDKSDNDNEISKGIFIFSGQWKYKKHQYNKDQGLLTATQDALVRQSKARDLV